MSLVLYWRLNCKSRVFRPTWCCLVIMVRRWYIITGCLAGVRHTRPCAGHAWLNFGYLRFGPTPRPSGRLVVYRSKRFGYRCQRIHRLRYLAVFDLGDQTMNLRLAKPVGPSPRTYQKCRLGLRHQRSSRQPHPIPTDAKTSFGSLRRADANFVNTASTIHRLEFRAISSPVYFGSDTVISIVPGVPCFHGLCRSGRFWFRVFPVEWLSSFGIAGRDWQGECQFGGLRWW